MSGEISTILAAISTMTKPATERENGPTGTVRESERDHPSFLADKFGVSRNTVLIVMSIAGPNEALIEKILRDNRFVR